MKPYRILIVLLLMLTLGACGNATPTPTGEDVMLNVYTAAAMTFLVQSNSIATRSTPTLASLPTSFASPIPPSSVTAYPTGASSGCYSSAYVSDVTIPDRTEIARGESFVKTWELKNTCSCAWDKDSFLTFYSGDDMDGEDTEIGEYVASGDSGEVSITMTAPDTDGTYTGYWILADLSGTAFGATFYVQIVVSSDLSTSTPTLTHTPTDSSTSTSTPRTAPSNTPTPVPTETSSPSQGSAPTNSARTTTIRPDDFPGASVIGCKDMT